MTVHMRSKVVQHGLAFCSIWTPPFLLQLTETTRGFVETDHPIPPATPSLSKANALFIATQWADAASAAVILVLVMGFQRQKLQPNSCTSHLVVSVSGLNAHVSGK